jgi:hypothetical protein
LLKNDYLIKNKILIMGFLLFSKDESVIKSSISVLD